MIQPYRIWFIGDSSASGIGLGREVFPRRVATLAAEGGYGPVRAVNCAVPGFTSTDAAALVRDIAGTGGLGAGSAVVLYLGNNEQAASRYKGRYSGLTRWRRALKSLMPETNGGGVVRWGRGGLHFEPDPAEAATANTVEDFLFNMRQVLKVVHLAGGRAVVVVPSANKRFPHGVGLPNAPWFKAAHSTDRISDFIRQWYDPDGGVVGGLYRGILALEKGRYGLAREFCVEAARADAPAVRAAAANNAAVALAGLGRVDEARRTLERAAAEHPLYAPIYLDNVARILRVQGRHGGADEADRAAFHADTSLYRVKDEGREALKLAAQESGAAIVDVDALAGGGGFVDYCHPTPDLHGRIAGAVMEALCDDLPRAGGECGYERWLVSPDAFSGRCGSLLDYYQIDRGEADPEGVFCTFMETSRVDVPEEDFLAEAIIGFTRSALEHPLFGFGEDLMAMPPQYWFEMLSFPEFHTYRILAVYLDMLERAGEGGMLAEYPGFDFSAAAYRDLVLMKRKRPLQRPVSTSPAYAARLVQSLRRYLRDRARFAIDPEVRRRTVIYWYTRESFRYGTQSRTSMLFDVWSYERAMEALLAACAIWRAADEGALFEAGQRQARLLAEHVTGLVAALDEGTPARDVDAVSARFLAEFDVGLGQLVCTAKREAS